MYESRAFIACFDSAFRVIITSSRLVNVLHRSYSEKFRKIHGKTFLIEPIL